MKCARCGSRSDASVCADRKACADRVLEQASARLAKPAKLSAAFIRAGENARQAEARLYREAMSQ